MFVIMLILTTIITSPVIPMPTPGVTAENFQRLRWGMEEKEVEAILGSRGQMLGGDSFGHCAIWQGSGVDIFIQFCCGGIARATLGYDNSDKTDELLAPPLRPFE